MAAKTDAAPSPGPDAPSPPLLLRESRELLHVPPERAPASAALPPPPPLAGTLPATPGGGQTASSGPPPSRANGYPRLIAAPPAELTWSLASLALAASVGWIYERRRRRDFETGGTTARWSTIRNTLRRKQSTLGASEAADTSTPGELAPPVYISVISETTSRREATLVDLHQLSESLKKRRAKSQISAAAELLEEHLVDFRYTSPWVFLELRELYRELDQAQEWELARDAFRTRFGQNAPQWNAPSTTAHELADDEQLCQELARKWPRRDARLFILRWMLGDALTRQKNFGPPQLPLGVYRDIMMIDAVLDEVMASRSAPAPALA